MVSFVSLSSFFGPSALTTLFPVNLVPTGSIRDVSVWSGPTCHPFMSACSVPKPPPVSGRDMHRAGVLLHLWRINPFDSGKPAGGPSDPVL
jgi:hypothetical protein